MYFSLNHISKQANRFLKKNSATILSVVGSIGVITTAYFSGKNSIEAYKAQQEENRDPKLSDVKYYIPTVSSGAITIGCIMGSNAISQKRQASLIAAYGVLRSRYLAYQKKVKELYGKEADTTVKEELVKESCSDTLKPKKDQVYLFYDEVSDRYFEKTMAEVLDAEYLANRSLSKDGYVNLNDFYSFLGLEKTQMGEILGWSIGSTDGMQGYAWIDFSHVPVEVDTNLIVYEILYGTYPSEDYLEY